MKVQSLFVVLLLTLAFHAFANIPHTTTCDTVRKTKGPNMGTYKIRCRYKEPVNVQGYPCIGWTWYYQDGLLDNFQVNETIIIQDIEIPQDSRVFLRQDGTLSQCYFSKDVTIQGYPCDGGHKKEATGFYPNGNLRFIFLTEQRTIQGIPCRQGGLSIIQFYESGKLKQNKLPHDFEYNGVKYKGRTKLFLDEGGKVLKTERAGFFSQLFFDGLYSVIKMF
jgi:hypothetical protein